MQIKKFLPKIFRSVFYALSLTFAIYLFADEVNQDGLRKNAFIFLAASFLIYSLELFLLAAEKNHKLNFFSEINDNELRFYLIVDLLLYPFFLILSISYLGYLNLSTGFIIYLAIFFLIILNLFLYLHKLFELKFFEEHLDRFPTDVIKIVLLMVSTGLFYLSSLKGNDWFLVGSIQILLITFLVSLTFINNLKYVIEKEEVNTVRYSLLISLITCLVIVVIRLIKGEELSTFLLSLYYLFIYLIIFTGIQKKLQDLLVKKYLLSYVIAIIASTFVILIF